MALGDIEQFLDSAIEQDIPSIGVSQSDSGDAGAFGVNEYELEATFDINSSTGDIEINTEVNATSWPVDTGSNIVISVDEPETGDAINMFDETVSGFTDQFISIVSSEIAEAFTDGSGVQEAALERAIENKINQTGQMPELGFLEDSYRLTESPLPTDFDYGMEDAILDEQFTPVTIPIPEMVTESPNIDNPTINDIIPVERWPEIRVRVDTNLAGPRDWIADSLEVVQTIPPSVLVKTEVVTLGCEALFNDVIQEINNIENQVRGLRSEVGNARSTVRETQNEIESEVDIIESLRDSVEETVQEINPITWLQQNGIGGANNPQEVQSQVIPEWENSANTASSALGDLRDNISTLENIVNDRSDELQNAGCTGILDDAESLLSDARDAEENINSGVQRVRDDIELIEQFINADHTPDCMDVPSVSGISFDIADLEEEATNFEDEITSSSIEELAQRDLSLDEHEIQIGDIRDLSISGLEEDLAQERDVISQRIQSEVERNECIQMLTSELDGLEATHDSLISSMEQALSGINVSCGDIESAIGVPPGELESLPIQPDNITSEFDPEQDIEELRSILSDVESTRRDLESYVDSNPINSIPCPTSIQDWRSLEQELDGIVTNTCVGEPFDSFMQRLDVIENDIESLDPETATFEDVDSIRDEVVGVGADLTNAGFNDEISDTCQQRVRDEIEVLKGDLDSFVVDEPLTCDDVPGIEQIREDADSFVFDVREIGRQLAHERDQTAIDRVISEGESLLERLNESKQEEGLCPDLEYRIESSLEDARKFTTRDLEDVKVPESLIPRESTIRERTISHADTKYTLVGLRAIPEPKGDIKENKEDTVVERLLVEGAVLVEGPPDRGGGLVGEMLVSWNTDATEASDENTYVTPNTAIAHYDDPARTFPFQTIDPQPRGVNYFELPANIPEGTTIGELPQNRVTIRYRDIGYPSSEFEQGNKQVAVNLTPTILDCDYVANQNSDIVQSIEDNVDETEELEQTPPERRSASKVSSLKQELESDLSQIRNAKDGEVVCNTWEQRAQSAIQTLNSMDAVNLDCSDVEENNKELTTTIDELYNQAELISEKPVQQRLQSKIDSLISDLESSLSSLRENKNPAASCTQWEDKANEGISLLESLDGVSEEVLPCPDKYPDIDGEIESLQDEISSLDSDTTQDTVDKLRETISVLRQLVGEVVEEDSCQREFNNKLDDAEIELERQTRGVRFSEGGGGSSAEREEILETLRKRLEQSDNQDQVVNSLSGQSEGNNQSGGGFNF